MSFDNLPKDLKEYINYEEGLARLRGNKMIYSKTLEIFLRTKEFDSLKEALEENDLKKADYAAHTIKGAAGNLSIAKIYEISSTLHEEFSQGIRSDDKVSELFEANEKTRDYIALLIEALAD